MANVDILSKFFRRDEMSLTKEKYVFTSSEIEAIKKEIYKELGVCRVNYWTTRVAILIALDTGMRPQEIQALKCIKLLMMGNLKCLK